jgi:hypothetical protein
VSTLAKMAQHGAVTNLPPAGTFEAVLANPSVCGACQGGGQKAVFFPRTPISAKTVQPYAKLQIDISGPRNQSLGGASYFTLMVDEATGFIWVFTRLVNYEYNSITTKSYIRHR